jgi:hypothetical protein
LRTGDLEGDVAGVAHDLRADLDQLLHERRQRPILDRQRRRQGTQEFAEIRGERVKLRLDGRDGRRDFCSGSRLCENAAEIAPLQKLNEFSRPQVDQKEENRKK